MKTSKKTHSLDKKNSTSQRFKDNKKSKNIKEADKRTMLKHSKNSQGNFLKVTSKSSSSNAKIISRLRGKIQKPQRPTSIPKSVKNVKATQVKKSRQKNSLISPLTLLANSLNEMIQEARPFLKTFLEQWINKPNTQDNLKNLHNNSSNDISPHSSEENDTSKEILEEKVLPTKNSDAHEEKSTESTQNNHEELNDKIINLS